MDAETNKIPDTTVFRPSKRRRFHRAPRQLSDDEHSDIQRPDAASLSDTPENGPASHSSEVTRLHRGKPRKNGILFSNTLPRSEHLSSSEIALMDPRTEQLPSMSTRFVAHSDQVVDVDKHMVDYIESEMAKRHLGRDTSTSAPDILAKSYNSKTHPNASGSPQTQAQALERQPASVGKIHEIDLGQDVSALNERRTELAMRRARGEKIPSEAVVPVRKVRLGRNGKPRKGPKRRNSEDIQRDQLVEQVLRESKLDLYAESTPQLPHDPSKPTTIDHTTASVSNPDLTTDDIVAEQFKADFLDAMQARRRHRPTTTGTNANKTAGGGAGVQQEARGPKLGGSRSARAAMREMQEREREKAGKK